jgi:ADP-ribosyl-[dinitrogen reductase] hydrolase
MALCLGTSLVECRGFDPKDQMDRYCRWAEEGYLSSTGTCFDIGGTVAAALKRYRRTGDPFSGSTDPWSAGNGCIMRLAPVPMYFFPDLEAAERYAAESSRTTHGTAECVDAARLLARILVRALRGQSKEEVLLGDRECFSGAPKIVRIARGEYLMKEEAEIRGSGYVVECLEAALWCFARAGSFQEAVLLAVNLGDDADTTGAVCGQVAGAFYGESMIPRAWLEKLSMGQEIALLAERLMRTSADPSRRSPRV